MNKSLLFLALILLGALPLSAQHSCCSASRAALAFSALGADPSFVMAHAEPRQIDYKPSFGSMVGLKTASGPEARAFEAKPGGGTGQVVLLFHEWWGLNDHIKKEAESLARETGFTVLALDLYDGKVTASREEAAKLSSSVDHNRIFEIIDAALAYAGKNGKVQTLGWCFGGAWSLQAAIRGGDKVTGCVMYYGMPETDPDRLSGLKAPVLGIFAKQDNFISPAVVDTFRVRMEGLSKPLEIKMYDADHAFANPSNPKYDKTATADARARAIAFLKENFTK